MYSFYKTTVYLRLLVVEFFLISFIALRCKTSFINSNFQSVKLLFPVATKTNQYTSKLNFSGLSFVFERQYRQNLRKSFTNVSDNVLYFMKKVECNFVFLSFSRTKSESPGFHQNFSPSSSHLIYII